VITLLGCPNQGIDFAALHGVRGLSDY